jgi:hypothetical protein
MNEDGCLAQIIEDLVGPPFVTGSLGPTPRDALDRLHEYLDPQHPYYRRRMERARPLAPLLCRSPLFRRAQQKPRRLAGDYLTLLMIYRNVAQGASRAAREMDAWMLDLATARALRWSRRLLARAVAECAKATARPVRILSAGSGPLAEFEQLGPEHMARIADVTTVDVDPKANAHVRASLGGRVPLRQIEDNVLRAMRTDLGQRYDLVYAVGMLDYLTDANARRLAGWLARHRAPGGRMLLGAVSPDWPDRGIFELAAWYRFPRGPQALFAIAREAGLGALALDIETDPGGTQHILTASPGAA